MLGLGAARLPDGRIEPEVADKLAGAVEARDIADGGHERRGGHQAHAGHGHQSPDLLRIQGVLRDVALQRCDLLVEESDLAYDPVDGLTFIVWQLEAGEPHKAALAERVSHRRATLEVAHQNRVHLVLASRPVTNELSPTREPATQRTGALVWQPAAVEQPGRQQPCEHPGVQPVGLDLRLGDRTQLLADRDDHAGDVRLDPSRDRQRVARRLQHDLVVWAKTLRQHVQPSGTGQHPTGGADLPVLPDRDLTKIEMNV